MKYSQKGVATIVLILVIVAIIVVGGAVYVSKNSPEAIEQPLVVGGDKDEYGCVGSAGYSWCEIKQRCLRPWEEKCEDANSLPVTTDDPIILEKHVIWGPCPPGGVCQKTTLVFKSGKVIFEGKTKMEEKLDSATVEAIIEKIRDLKLMTRACPASPVMDYSATYKINLDGETTEIMFPGCQKELAEIDALLPKVNLPIDGGA